MSYTPPQDVLERYEAKRTNVIELADQISALPQLDSATAVMARFSSLAPRLHAKVARLMTITVKMKAALRICSFLEECSTG